MILLLQNVERGSQTLDLHASDTQSLSLSQLWRDHRKACPASGMHSTAVYLRHVSKEDGPQHSLTLSLCSLSMIRVKVYHLAHHQEWKAKYPIQKNLWLKNISYRNDPGQVFPWLDRIFKPEEISLLLGNPSCIRASLHGRRCNQATILQFFACQMRWDASGQFLKSLKSGVQPGKQLTHSHMTQ